MPRFLWIVILALSAFSLPAAAGDKYLTIEDVRTMAFDQGDRARPWHLEAESRDASGHKIEMEIDGASGEILKIKRH